LLPVGRLEQNSRDTIHLVSKCPRRELPATVVPPLISSPQLLFRRSYRVEPPHKWCYLPVTTLSLTVGWSLIILWSITVVWRLCFAQLHQTMTVHSRVIAVTNRFRAISVIIVEGASSDSTR
jgi:hypothetical protein